MNGSPTTTRHDHDHYHTLSSPAIDSDADGSTIPSDHSENPHPSTNLTSPPDTTPNAMPNTTSNMTAEILHVAYMRGDLADLPERIFRAVTTTAKPCPSNPLSPSCDGPAPAIATPGPVSPVILRMLLSCLRTLGVDFDPAIAAVESHRVHRCTRCAASFRAVDNTPTACAVPHAPPLVSWDIELVADGVEPCETRYYTCCGTCVVVFPGQEEEDVQVKAGMCYVGPHVAAASPVQDVEQEHRAGAWHEHEHERRGFDVAEGASVGAGKPHLQERPPSMQAQMLEVPGPGTSVPVPIPVPVPVPRQAIVGEAGKLVPHSRLSRTAAWVNSTAATQSAAGQHYGAGRYFDIDGGPAGTRTLTMRNVNMNVDGNMNGNMNAAAPMPTTGRIIETIPWRQSSLYHPPGWIMIPPGLRRPGDSPYA
ncbi:hypothetical protein L226DRAFT_530699 [Lentinus tigrinus ALCF2SS1-7]|nr:hypothetical protein L226DRAFT_530699 [Lentinus tigrinus ALCF2SS1-7]